MNKPDSTGESLESILASIRRSLAEQSTGALEDEPGPATLLPPEAGTADDADVPRLFGGSGAAAAEAPAGERQLLARLDDDPPPPASTMAAPMQEAAPPAPALTGTAAAPAGLDNPAPSASPSASATIPLPPQPAQRDAGRDQLWFLAGRGEADRKDAAAPAPNAEAPARPAAPAPKAPILEPRPARTEIVRGPLPPFFGSSAEAAKVEVAPVAGAPSVTSPMPPPGPAPAAASPLRPLDADPLRGVQAEAQRAPTWPPSAPVPPASPLPPLFSEPPVPASPVPPASRDGLANGKASFLAPPPAAPMPGPAGPAASAGTGAAGDALPHVRGLEAMVAELLRPMLRRWLDENMPRLVSAALKAEADLMSGQDPKKP